MVVEEKKVEVEDELAMYANLEVAMLDLGKGGRGHANRIAGGEEIAGARNLEDWGVGKSDGIDQDEGGEVGNCESTRRDEEGGKGGSRVRSIELL